MSKVATTLGWLVQRHEQFNGKDVFCYLRDYKSEMLHGSISEGLKVLSFNLVATDGLQGNIHKRRQQYPTWAAFEEALKLTYSIEDSSKETQRGFEDWVETPKRGIKALKVFTDFER